MNAGQILLWPLLLAALSVGGLVLGLTGSGWRDALAVLLVGLPILVTIVARARARRHNHPHASGHDLQ